MPEKLQILQDQYESDLIKMTRANTQIDCLRKQELSIQSLLDQIQTQIHECFVDRRAILFGQVELRQAIREEKEKGESL
jgi:hypothetical protein